MTITQANHIVCLSAHVRVVLGGWLTVHALPVYACSGATRPHSLALPDATALNVVALRLRWVLPGDTPADALRLRWVLPRDTPADALRLLAALHQLVVSLPQDTRTRLRELEGMSGGEGHTNLAMCPRVAAVAEAKADGT